MTRLEAINNFWTLSRSKKDETMQPNWWWWNNDDGKVMAAIRSCKTVDTTQRKVRKPFCMVSCCCCTWKRRSKYSVHISLPLVSLFIELELYIHSQLYSKKFHWILNVIWFIIFPSYMSSGRKEESRKDIHQTNSVLFNSPFLYSDCHRNL